MTTAALIVMLLSVGSVLCLVTFCVTKVLALPPIDFGEVKGPLDIDTGDTEDAD